MLYSITLSNRYAQKKDYVMKARKYQTEPMIRLMSDISKSTGKLLEEKGFSNCLKSGLLEKIVLLNTEIAELTDAIKKNLGQSEEGFELADIIIRASNFCCDKEYKEDFEDFIDMYSRSCPKSCLVYIPDYHEVNVKFVIIDNLMERLSHISLVFNNAIRKTGINDFWWCLPDVWSEIIEMIMICEVYCDLFLEKNLQFYIDEKMKKNFERPYQYNSDGLHK